MNYLFFDMEYATSKGGINKVCEFGYVITNESFDVIERDNFIINPNISRSKWDYRVVKKILSRSIEDYEHGQKFPVYYNQIKALIQNADLVFGHTLYSDAKAINDECIRYNLGSISYDFYDVRVIYKEFFHQKKNAALTTILMELGVADESLAHDAENDAYKTMLALKKITEVSGLSVRELIKQTPSCVDRSHDLKVDSIERSKAEKNAKFDRMVSGDSSLRELDNLKYRLVMDNVKPNGQSEQRLKEKKVSISIAFEKERFNDMLKLIRIVANEGGEYTNKSSESNVFVKYDSVDENGEPRIDSRFNHVTASNEEGADIQIINFSDFLKMIDLDDEKMKSMPDVDFDFIFDEETIIKDESLKGYVAGKKKSRKAAEKRKSNSLTWGDVFGDELDKLKDELPDSYDD